MANTINDIKERGESLCPLFLWLFTWPDASTLAVATHAVSLGGVDYLPRVIAQQINPIQALSPQGIEIPASVKVTLADADKDLWAIEVDRKFRGARLKVTFGFYDFETAAWSDDVVVPFLGRCDQPEVTDDALVISASFILNLEAKMLPAFPIQPRCPKLFPATAEQKALADIPGSPYYPCGVTDPDKTSCTFDQAGCDANDNSLRFGGLTKEVPPVSKPSRSYTSGDWIENLKSDPSSAKYGDYVPIGYGELWVDCIGLGAWPQADSTRGLAIVCEGRPQKISKVIADDRVIDQARELDYSSYLVPERLMRWEVVSNGDRTGRRASDIPWNSLAEKDDPHGSQCVIEWCVFSKLTTSQARVRALVQFPKVRAYAKIEDVVDGVATLANDAPNTDIAGNPPYTITIFGNSNEALNGTWGLFDWHTGPPGTVTLLGTTESGTGGYIAYDVKSDQYAWAILDVLRRCGLSIEDVDLDAFSNAANRHKRSVGFTARDGSSSTHPQYTCSMVIRQRRSAAAILTGMLRGCNSHLGRNLTTGKIALFARGTIEEQQPDPVDGSNDSTPTADGYVAYHFDESSMVRDQSKLTRAGKPAGNSPNVVTVPFSNEENEYSTDSVEVIDPDEINLMGQQIPGDLQVDGINALDRANRIGSVFLAEQLGAETWRWTTTAKAVKLLVGQIIAVSSEKFGFERQLMRVQSIAPKENWETCAIEATLHSDAWYAPDFRIVTGNPATGPRRDRLMRPAFVWAPYQVQPEVGDPLFGRTDWTFALQLTYQTLRNGDPGAVAKLTGKMPVNDPQDLKPPVLAAQGTTADSGGSVPGAASGQARVYSLAVAQKIGGKPGPLSNVCHIAVAQDGDDNTITAPVRYWDPAGEGYYIFVGSPSRLVATNDAGYSGTPSDVTVTDIPECTWGAPDTECDRLIVRPRLCWHAGVFGAALSGVGEFSLTIAGAGWDTDEWAGRECIVLSKTDLSVLGLLHFKVVSNTADTLTLDGDGPDPDELGVDPGDALVMLSVPTVSGMTLTDEKWENTLENNGDGLAVSQEKGRIGYIWAGKGRGYRYPVVSNTATAITFKGPWIIEPDSTSRMIILDAGKLPESESESIENADQAAAMELQAELTNYAGKTVLLEVVAIDGGRNESAPHLNPVRLLYVTGSQGTRSIAASDTQRVTDGLVLCDTSAAEQPDATTLAAAVDATATSITVADGSDIVDGTYLEIEDERMRVHSGGGTESLEVERGGWGTTAAAHDSGEAVTVPGALEFQCLAAVEVPNHWLTVRKASDDLNFVRILAAAGGDPDTFEGGSSEKILPDSTAERGVTLIKFPG